MVNGLTNPTYFSMNEESCLKSLRENLLDLLRKVSIAQTNQYFNCADVELVPSPANHALGQVLKRYIVMILLTGSDVRMVFKVHFNPEQIRAYCQSTGGKTENLTDKHLVDYMKELCNQIGGRASRLFQSQGISIGMSIPLCTRGIYEIYADYQEKSGVVNKFGGFWRLNGPFGFLYCSCYVELLAAEPLKNIHYVDEHSDEGELDFL